MIATQQPTIAFKARSSRLVFSPLAWLKLQYFCLVGDTEIGGFAITPKDDPLYVAEFVTVRQQVTPVTVAFADDAMADYMDRCVDAGISPQNCMRIWCHTHPGSSVDPSMTDEETFARVFGSCDWAVMFILGRTGNTYARLSVHAGPGAAVHLPVSVEWSAWPAAVNDPVFSIPNRFAEWQQEYAANIQRIPESLHLFAPKVDAIVNTASPWEPFADAWDWNDLDIQNWEDYERNEHHYDF